MFGFGNFGADVGDVDFDRARTWQDYDRVVQAGLPAEDRDRLAEAYSNLRYANGHFDDALAARTPGQTTNVVKSTSGFFDTIASGPSSEAEYQKADYRLFPPIAKRVANKLSENLYKRPPTRRLKDEAASAILDEIYKRNGMASKWAEADRLTVVGGFCAFQFAGTDDPYCPIKVQLWSADQVVVWTDPQDHEKPRAVVTLDAIDGRTRATLWTEEKVVTYTTKRAGAGETRQFEPLTTEDNPYRDEDGNGIIPFSFCHFREPATEFTTDSPGTNLRELNSYIIHGLDDTADGVRYLIRPIGLALGVDEAWEAPAVIKPGMFLNLAAANKNATDQGADPRLDFAQADTGWVAVVWAHLNNYLDLALEMEGVPPATIRMMMGDRSGISILSEQAPLLGWTQHRRSSFEAYELQCVKKCLQVIAAHLRNHGHDASRFDAVALDPDFKIRWPRLYVDLPGPERDRADGFRVATGRASLIDLVMEQEDCTRDQALESLNRVKKDNDELAALGIEPVPAVFGPKTPPAFGGFGDQGGGAPGFNQLMDQSSGAAGKAPLTGEPVDANAQSDGLSQEGG